MGCNNHVASLPNVSTHDVVNHLVEFHQVGCTHRMLNPIGIGLKLNSKGCEGVMSNSWKATLTSLCINERHGRTLARQCFDSDIVPRVVSLPTFVLATTAQLYSAFSFMCTDHLFYYPLFMILIPHLNTCFGAPGRLAWPCA